MLHLQRPKTKQSKKTELTEKSDNDVKKTKDDIISKFLKATNFLALKPLKSDWSSYGKLSFTFFTSGT